MKKYRLIDIIWFRNEKREFIPVVVNNKRNKIKFVLTDEVIILDEKLSDFKNCLDFVSSKENIEKLNKVTGKTIDVWYAYWTVRALNLDICKNEYNIESSKLRSTFYISRLAKKMYKVAKKETTKKVAENVVKNDEKDTLEF